MRGGPVDGPAEQLREQLGELRRDERLLGWRRSPRRSTSGAAGPRSASSSVCPLTSTSWTTSRSDEVGLPVVHRGRRAAARRRGAARPAPPARGVDDETDLLGQLARRRLPQRLPRLDLRRRACTSTGRRPAASRGRPAGRRTAARGPRVQHEDPRGRTDREPVSHRVEHGPFGVGQRVGRQRGSRSGRRAAVRRSDSVAAPAGDRGVVAGQQHRRHLEPAPGRRLGVGRALEQPVGVRVELDATRGCRRRRAAAGRPPRPSPARRTSPPAST